MKKIFLFNLFFCVGLLVAQMPPELRAGSIVGWGWNIDGQAIPPTGIDSCRCQPETGTAWR